LADEAQFGPSDRSSAQIDEPAAAPNADDATAIKSPRFTPARNALSRSEVVIGIFVFLTTAMLYPYGCHRISVAEQDAETWETNFRNLAGSRPFDVRYGPNLSFFSVESLRSNESSTFNAGNCMHEVCFVVQVAILQRSPEAVYVAIHQTFADPQTRQLALPQRVILFPANERCARRWSFEHSHFTVGVEKTRHATTLIGIGESEYDQSMSLEDVGIARDHWDRANVVDDCPVTFLDPRDPELRDIQREWRIAWMERRELMIRPVPHLDHSQFD